VQKRIDEAFRSLPPSRDATARFTPYAGAPNPLVDTLVAAARAVGDEASLAAVDAALDAFDGLVSHHDPERLADALKQFVFHHQRLGLIIPPLEHRAPEKVKK
jgi:hypothetical protein